jgi:hypothetical protein
VALAPVDAPVVDECVGVDLSTLGIEGVGQDMNDMGSKVLNAQHRLVLAQQYSTGVDDALIPPTEACPEAPPELAEGQSRW